MLWRHDSYVDRARAGIPSILERRYDLPERVKIELDDDQALVLFDWLCHLNDGEAPVVTHQADNGSFGTFKLTLRQFLSRPSNQITPRCSHKRKKRVAHAGQ